MTVEDGFIPTPPPVAEYMVKQLFVEAPSADDRILFPGAGTGCLAAAVRRYCSVRDQPCPEAVAVDTSAERLDAFQEHVASSEPTTPPLSTRSKHRLRTTYPTTSPSADAPVAMDVDVQCTDFLLDPPEGEFDYIISNPPYTRYLALEPSKRDRYRERFDSAEGQFGLYMPFIEQAQRLLAPDGHLVFIAPVGYLLSSNADAFRNQLRRDKPEHFMLMPARVFGDVQVEPVVTALRRDESLGKSGRFWLESFTWESRVDDILADVGVQEAGKRDELVEGYYENYEFTRGLLGRRQRRYGEEGGYDVKSIPPEMRPEPARQADLGEWC